MRNNGNLPGQLADNEKRGSEEEDPSDPESDSDVEEDEVGSSDDEGGDSNQIDANERTNVIMNVFIPLYLFQRAVKVSGLKFLIISIYLPPSLASNLNI